MKKWLVLAFVAVPKLGLPDVVLATEADIHQAMEISRRVPVAEAIRNNPGKKEEVIKAFEARMDAALEQMLARKPLFPCVLPRDKQPQPPLVLELERHDNPSAKERHSERFQEAEEGKIFYVVEAAVAGDERSLRQWAVNHVENRHQAPANLRGMAEPLSETLSGWMSFAAAQLPLVDGLSDEVIDGILGARLNLFYNIMGSEADKKVYKQIRKKIKPSPLSAALDVLYAQQEITPEKQEKILSKLSDLKVFADGAGWATTYPQMMDAVYQLKYAPLATKEEKRSWKEFTSHPSLEKDYAKQLVINWRDLEFAINIAKAYCESLKREKPLPVIVSLGALHGYGLKRVLEQDQKSLKVDVQLLPGAIDIFRELDSLSGNR